MLRKLYNECPECEGRCRVLFTRGPPVKRRRLEAPRTSRDIEHALSARYERWVAFRRQLSREDYYYFKPNLVGKLHLLHHTTGPIAAAELDQVLCRGRVMMNRIYAKQSTTSKNAIVQQHPALVASLAASQQALHRLEVEQSFYRMRAGETTRRAASYACMATQVRERALLGTDHSRRGLAAVRALPCRETASLPLEVIHSPADPSVVGGEDALESLLNGTDEKLTLDFSFGGAGV